ncbi:MAG: proline--tRNA ligase, partial [Planctomycetaceae bacterium]|nr:proline--tRNA ligase [Planctomycetaceae bacterium]
LHCTGCGYAANQEKAEIGARNVAASDVAQKPLTKIPTPGAHTIEQVSAFLKCKPHKLIKTLIYVADGQPIAVLVRGDHEANEGKIRRGRKAEKLELASPEVIEKVTGAPVGFAGPVGMKEKIPLLADYDVASLVNGIAGANEAETHIVGVNINRDFTPDLLADLRNAVDGDPCPRCSGKLKLRHAIEVGHVFKLGTKYTAALGAKFLDADEQLKPIIMGCYGIGVNRIIAGLVETSHDQDGIIWPMSLAPYEVLLTPVKVPDEASMKVARELHDQLTAAGVDVLVDDRDCRAGVKFKDGDLIGVPLRVVIGDRGLKEGKLEVKWRWEKAAETIDLVGAAETLADLIRRERSDNARFRAQRDK